MEVLPGSVAESLLDESDKRQIDELGRLSGIAQALTGPITTVQKLVASASTPGHEHHLLLYRDGQDKILGFAKYSSKDLYVYRKNGTMVQVSPLCLLDFYVSEDVQRQGIGLQLFNRMLHECNTPPHKIAYDRPSPKLLAFMKKHFGLAQPDLQPNRYCLFKGFLEDA